MISNIKGTISPKNLFQNLKNIEELENNLFAQTENDFERDSQERSLSVERTSHKELRDFKKSIQDVRKIQEIQFNNKRTNSNPEVKQLQASINRKLKKKQPIVLPRVEFNSIDGGSMRSIRGRKNKI